MTGAMTAILSLTSLLTAPHQTLRQDKVDMLLLLPAIVTDSPKAHPYNDLATIPDPVPYRMPSHCNSTDSPLAGIRSTALDVHTNTCH